MSYIQRTSVPTKDDPHYASNNPFHISGYGMPNCTCYAWGRAYEIIGSRPKLCTGNAEAWYSYNDGYQRGSVPMVGAIMCWAKGSPTSSADGAGHVAVVEQINADGSVVTSESGWKSSLFWWRKVRYKGDGNWGQDSSYKFLGCIYLPVGSTSTTLADLGLPMLRQGVTSDTVKALQILLSGYGNDPGGIDRNFGVKTYAALMAYQKSRNLDADGVCGNITWHSLLGLEV